MPLELKYACFIFKLNFCLCGMLRKGSDVMLFSNTVLEQNKDLNSL
jgi:hypothetical protein